MGTPHTFFHSLLVQRELSPSEARYVTTTHFSLKKIIAHPKSQIIATRAAVPLSDEERASWGGNEHFEYWFPRPPKTEEDINNPLIILGGGREGTGGYEIGTTDDSVINPKVSKPLREFLPAVFPEKFKKGTEPEREWVRVFCFSVLFLETYERVPDALVNRLELWDSRLSTTLSYVDHIFTMFSWIYS